MAGFGCLIRVKMTRSAGDLTGPGLITAQIFVFRDNPLKYTDPDGKIVTNKTQHAIVVRTEDGDYLLLGPGAIYFGKVDGVLTQDGKTYKISDHEASPLDINIEVTQNEEGNYEFNLPDRPSRVLNWLGDRVKQLSKDESRKKDLSGELPNRAEGFPAKSWWLNEGGDKGALHEFGEPDEWDMRQSFQTAPYT
jgi:hypothetical protein